MATKAKTTSRAKTTSKAKAVSNGSGRGVNRIKGALCAPDPEKIVIRPPELRTFKVTLKGTSPLVVHKFSEKAKKSIEDKQQHKGKTAKGKRDPKAEYLSACYVFPKSKAGAKGCKYGLPAITVKAAMVSACRMIDDLPMTKARCAFQVLAEDDGLVTLKFKGAHPRMREDTIRLPNGSLDLRYRPEFADWSVTVAMKYNVTVISAEMIVNLLSIAGFHCGLCEMRPNSKSGPGGSNGMFEVQTA